MFVKLYGFLSFAKNINKNISKNLSCKYSQKLVDHTKKIVTYALRNILRKIHISQRKTESY